MKWSCPINTCDFMIEKTMFGKHNIQALGLARSNHLRKHKVFLTSLSPVIRKKRWGEQDRLIAIHFSRKEQNDIYL